MKKDRVLDFEDQLNALLNDPRWDEMEAIEVIGILQLKVAVMCQRMMRTEDADPRPGF